MKTRRRLRTVLLDTNVWQYIADCDASHELHRRARQANVRIQIAPSVVYEALRTQDVGRRARSLDVMTRPSWMRLMPEAYHEAQEILGEVRRLRPEWLRTRRNDEHIRRLQFDWMRSNGGFWDRARFTPEREAAAIQALDRGVLDSARSQAKQARDMSADAGLRYEKVQLQTMKARLDNPIPGWDGDDIDPWRVSASWS
jgi:hypothetical protein